MFTSPAARRTRMRCCTGFSLPSIDGEEPEPALIRTDQIQPDIRRRPNGHRGSRSVSPRWANVQTSRGLKLRRAHRGQSAVIPVDSPVASEIPFFDLNEL